jgi:hypothetical protein
LYTLEPTPLRLKDILRLAALILYPSPSVDKIFFSLISLPNDDELSALGIQGLKEDLLDKVVKLNVEYR